MKDPSSIQKRGQSRRLFMLVAGSLGLTGLLYWYQTGEVPGVDDTPNVDDVKDAVGSTSILPNQHLEQMEWSGNNLNLEFDPTTSADGFGIIHENQDSINDAVVYGSIPELEPTLQLPLPDLIHSDGRNFPTRVFVLQFYEGEFSEWDSPAPGLGLVKEKLSSVSITIPEEQWEYATRTVIEG